MGINSNIDILKKIADMEHLRNELLSNTADFFKATTASPKLGEKSSADILCTILTTTYLLAAQLGIDYKELDDKAIIKLRQEVLNNEEAIEIKQLLRHLS